jgi:hypothetical protein
LVSRGKLTKKSNVAPTSSRSASDSDNSDGSLSADSFRKQSPAAAGKGSSKKLISNETLTDFLSQLLILFTSTNDRAIFKNGLIQAITKTLGVDMTDLVTVTRARKISTEHSQFQA